MSNRISDEPDLAVAKMASLTVDDSSCTVTNIVANDALPNDAADATRRSTKPDLSTSSTTSSVKPSPDTADNFSKADLPTSSADSATQISTNTASNESKAQNGIANTQQDASTAIQSTEPIPVVYPPRRPNIFRTREKHLRYPIPDTVHSTQALEAADGFSIPDLQEFQAEIKEKMKKKTEIFMNMVRQSAWQQRRVEDLGEVFEIED